jgi:hypothetical protein
MTKGNVGKRRDAATDGHAVGGHAAGGDTTGDCCDSCDKPLSHDTSGISWAKLMARVGGSDGIPCHGADGPQEERFQGRSAPTTKSGLERG